MNNVIDNIIAGLLICVAGIAAALGFLFLVTLAILGTTIQIIRYTAIPAAICFAVYCYFYGVPAL